jgi:hypothetical protein
MNITVGRLRKMIREALIREGGGAPATKPRPYVRNALSPATADREQLGRQSSKDIDTEDELSPHLRDQTEDPEDCYGPVPPTQGDPYVNQDMFVRDSSPLPTQPIRK